jgi:beta-mannosidase
VPVSGTVKIQLYHLQHNEFRKEIVREVTLEPGKSRVVVRLDEAGIRAFRKEHILFAQWTANDGKVFARTNALADIERRCIFPDAKLDVSVEGNSLVITTDKFARNINLVGNADGEKLGWFFEDNYFDLFPGETKVVRVLGHRKTGVITAKPWYSEFETTIDLD